MSPMHGGGRGAAVRNEEAEEHREVCRCQRMRLVCCSYPAVHQ